jgi:hypothetical protein
LLRCDRLARCFDVVSHSHQMRDAATGSFPSPRFE